MTTSVELQELRIFLTLAQEQHFGRTAERLLLSQSRVSQAVRTLERKLGGRLFDRTSRTVNLTPFGMQVRDDVGRAYDELQAALRRSNARSGAVVGTLRIGIYGNGLNAGPHMTAIVQAFVTEHAECRIEFVDLGSMADSLAPLRSGHVDLITARLPLDEPDLTIGPALARQARVLLVARHDPLAGRDAVDYDEIGDRPVGVLGPALPASFREAFIPLVTPAGRRLTPAVGVLGTATETNMQVALGELVHVAVEGWTERHPHPDVVAVPIRDLPESVTALAWLTAVNSPRTAAFVDCADRVLQEAERLGPGRR